jgi:hypothetical protein
MHLEGQYWPHTFTETSSFRVEQEEREAWVAAFHALHSRLDSSQGYEYRHSRAGACSQERTQEHQSEITLNRNPLEAEGLPDFLVLGLRGWLIYWCKDFPESHSKCQYSKSR